MPHNGDALAILRSANMATADVLAYRNTKSNVAVALTQHGVQLRLDL